MKHQLFMVKCVIAAALLTAFAAIAPVFSQMNGGGTGFPGPGMPAAAASFQGAGDVFTTSPYAAYSCARVFTAAQASTSTSLCDLNAITGGAAVCTLRGSTSGFVDQSAYCPGSLTPAAACAAASGGACNVSQMYDLTGNSRHVVQATNANRPGITFSSSPTGTLPVLNCTIGTNPVLATSGTVTQAQPLSASGVVNRTGTVALGGAVGANSGISLIKATASANQAAVAATAQLTATANDSTWHAINTLANSTSSAINVNGSDTTGNAGASGFSANNIRLCRANATAYTGLIAEAWIWAAATNSTDRGNLSTNQHSASGYGSF